MKMRIRVLVAVAVAVTPAGAGAEGWVDVPGGIGWEMSYVTSGVFQCVARNSPPGACVAAGNTLTLTSGGSSLTLTFTGVDRTIVATNQSTRHELGTVTQAQSGGPFLFPPPLSKSSGLFILAIQVEHVTHPAATRTLRRGWRPSDPDEARPNCCTLGRTWARFPTTAPPAHFTYGAVVFHNVSFPTLTDGGGPYVIEASVGVIPEPGTVALLGTGLAGLAGVTLLRRRRD